MLFIIDAVVAALLTIGLIGNWVWNYHLYQKFDILPGMLDIYNRSPRKAAIISAASMVISIAAIVALQVGGLIITAEICIMGVLIDLMIYAYLFIALRHKLT